MTRFILCPKSDVFMCIFVYFCVTLLHIQWDQTPAGWRRVSESHIKHRQRTAEVCHNNTQWIKVTDLWSFSSHTVLQTSTTATKNNHALLSAKQKNPNIHHICFLSPRSDGHLLYVTKPFVWHPAPTPHCSNHLRRSQNEGNPLTFRSLKSWRHKWICASVVARCVALLLSVGIRVASVVIE